MKSEIVAIGSEMLTPHRQDTNSLFLTEKLNDIGVNVAFKTIVGDRLKDLVNAIRTALSRTDIVILMGGLGATLTVADVVTVHPHAWHMGRAHRLAVSSAVLPRPSNHAHARPAAFYRLARRA